MLFQITLYLAIRLLTLHIEAVRKFQELPSVQTHPSHPGCHRDALLRRFRSFWTIVWEGRESIFDYYLHKETLLHDDTAHNNSLRYVVTDCLLAIGSLIDDIYGSVVLSVQLYPH